MLLVAGEIAFKRLNDSFSWNNATVSSMYVSGPDSPTLVPLMFTSVLHTNTEHCGAAIKVPKYPPWVRVQLFGTKALSITVNADKMAL